MRRIEDLSYEEIIRYGLPFDCNIAMDVDTIVNIISDDKKIEKFISDYTTILDELIDKYGFNYIKFLRMLSLGSNKNNIVLKYYIDSLVWSILDHFDIIEYPEYEMNPFLGKIYENGYSDAIKIYTKDFEKIKNKLVDIKTFKELKKFSKNIYGIFLNVLNRLKEKTELNDMELEKCLKIYIKACINTLNNLENDLEKFIKEVDEINLDYKLLNYIDKKKLMLYICKQYLENIKIMKLSDDGVIQSALYIYKFLNDFDHSSTISIDGMYFNRFFIKNKKIDFTRIQQKKYSNFKLKSEFEEFLSKNSSLKEQLELLSKQEKEKFNNMSIDEVNKYIRNILDGGKDNWELANEEQLNSEINVIFEKSKDTSISFEEKKKLELIIKKLSILLKNKPLKVIKGVDTFKGYYGFIYPNGKIILETLYDDVDKKKISSGNASYCINLVKFEEYAKLKKKFLMRKKDVSRIIHNNNTSWEEKLLGLIKNGDEVHDISKKDLNGINIDDIVNLEELDKYKQELDRLKEQFPKEERRKKIKKVERRKKKIILDKVDKEEKENPSGEFITIQDKVDFISTQNELEIDITANNFIEFMKEYYKLLEENEKLRSKRQNLKRNPAISKYTKQRANCTCDLCGDKYISENDFDSHHLIPLKDGGPDNIYNTVCLCPNCHRIAHTTGFTNNEMYLLMYKIINYLKKENLEEYLDRFNMTFNNYLEMYNEEDWFMTWNNHKR